MTNSTPPDGGDGHWRYAVREVDEDGDLILWTTHGSWDWTPFSSAEEAAEFAGGFMTDGSWTVVRAWVPAPEWEVVDV